MVTHAVHQQAIDAMLSELTPDERQILKDEQESVDRDQRPDQSREHSMTGIENASQNPREERLRYIGFTEDYLHEQIAKAIAQKANSSVALRSLGKAIHALQDATSPQHRPFQEWRFDESFGQQIDHVWGERLYPNGALRAELQCVTRWAYEIYAGKVAMPEHFFQESGELQLPQGCQRN